MKLNHPCERKSKGTFLLMKENHVCADQFLGDFLTWLVSVWFCPGLLSPPLALCYRCTPPCFCGGGAGSSPCRAGGRVRPVAPATRFPSQSWPPIWRTRAPFPCANRARKGLGGLVSSGGHPLAAPWTTGPLSGLVPLSPPIPPTVEGLTFVNSSQHRVAR